MFETIVGAAIERTGEHIALEPVLWEKFLGGERVSPRHALIELDGTKIVTATAVQKLMVEDAIDRLIEITVWRNGALVDVIAVPRELDTSNR